ncbi:NADH dehydrogenase i chain j [Luminiphilus syltensis NOR5-1B]|uniref:NADH-quinone oxidoreductase subunit J n=1 Tax=Luminiphilus syltensis NOR5-1B TaxID=565045 RepID=B8KTH2_9GAMM|nr:NADH-quinone oxidoreductase subunit J [Luminiphilus syltensis]EED35003.1 NADH dehydrogenase i chain j [Luminiphilus syltensis NOR5-1B]
MTVLLFYLTAALAVFATVVALTRANAAHALIYLILSLLAVAVMFFMLGAPFAAALEVLIYAGAIMVLFVFVIMMLNLGDAGEEQERGWLDARLWIVPGLLTTVLLVEMLLVFGESGVTTSGHSVSPKEVGISLYGPYVLAVELASMLLMAALVGAYHVARRFIDRPGDI